MAVLVNYKICDNAEECGGIAVCSTGALFWDAEEKMIKTDNNLCISCGICEKECPVGALLVADTKESYAELSKVIEKDTHTVEELFVERYGAMPIDEKNVLDEKNAKSLVLENHIVFLEYFQDASVQCLLHSIPAADITERFGGTYKKVRAAAGSEEEYPYLKVYRDGTLSGQVDGYYDDSDKEKLFKKIDDVLI